MPFPSRPLRSASADWCAAFAVSPARPRSRLRAPRPSSPRGRPARRRAAAGHLRRPPEFRCERGGASARPSPGPGSLLTAAGALSALRRPGVRSRVSPRTGLPGLPHGVPPPCGRPPSRRRSSTLRARILSDSVGRWIKEPGEWRVVAGARGGDGRGTGDGTTRCAARSERRESEDSGDHEDERQTGTSRPLDAPTRAEVRV